MFAAACPPHAVEITDSGAVVAWDRVSGTRRTLGDPSLTVTACAIEPDGSHVWWFTESGGWWRQPFDGGPALPGAPPGRQRGIAFDADGRTVAVCLGTGDRTVCHLGPPGGTARPVAAADGCFTLADLSADGELLVLAGTPGTPTAAMLITPGTAEPPVVLGGRIWPLELRPGREVELLLAIEEDDRFAVAVWTPDAGLSVQKWLRFDTEITAHWYGREGRRVLVQQDRHGRSTLLLADLDSRTLTPVPTPPGTILDLSEAPDGVLHYVFSTEGVPPHRRTADPRRPAAPAVPRPDRTRRALWTGEVHTLLATPDGAGPWPAVQLLHGGPFLHDRDCHDPRVEALVRAGYAVARTNYRGSTGYGARWRRAGGPRVGHTQLDDLAAVRAHLIADGVAEAGRIALWGHSWGGYLALLGMGVRPGEWVAGLASSPVADYPAAYAQTTPALRELDDELFGGGPDRVPERYRDASPLTWASRVSGPLCIAAATGDDRCPPGQIHSYLAVLRRHGVPHRMLWTGGGHDGEPGRDTAVFTAMLAFADAALKPPRSDDHRAAREVNRYEATQRTARPDQLAGA